jgi:hypothetical protein
MAWDSVPLSANGNTATVLIYETGGAAYANVNDVYARSNVAGGGLVATAATDTAGAHEHHAAVAQPDMGDVHDHRHWRCPGVKTHAAPV